jgi:hypothetical protein
MAPAVVNGTNSLLRVTANDGTAFSLFDPETLALGNGLLGFGNTASSDHVLVDADKIEFGWKENGRVAATAPFAASVDIRESADGFLIMWNEDFGATFKTNATVTLTSKSFQVWVVTSPGSPTHFPGL